MKTSLISILLTAILLAPACALAGSAKNLTDAKVETYSYADELVPSLLYDVKVNGQRQFVYPTPEPHICAFGCDSEVEVEICSLSSDIKSVAVRPLNKKYPWSLKNGVITLRLKPYEKAVVELNGSEENPLFIFANPLESEKPAKDNPSVKYFEAGKIYTPGLLKLESGETLYIEGGAVVNGCLDLREKNDVTIDGCGILNCHPGDSRGIFALRCKNLTLKNIIEINKNNWTTFFAECEGLRSDNYKAVASISQNGAENDAFDILGCHDVEVRRGFSYCHDDAFCIKCRKWNYGGPSSDILIEDCMAWNCLRGNCFEFGYELQDDATRITFRNIYSIHSAGNPEAYRRGSIGLHNGAGGCISNVLYENVWLEDPKEFGIHMIIMQSDYNIGTGVQWSPGKISNVTLRNVHIEKLPPEGNFIQGYDSGEHKIKGIRFEGLWIKDRRIRSARDGNFDIKNAEVIFN
ncbi:MAG: hypothetical protein J5764_05040 [Bacteroidales bacterium]|nr:hypothetical protein [Bacteroidales bacterium]